MATYELTQGIPENIKAGDILNCSYSGRPIGITLPPGNYKFECYGAQGGSGYNSSSRTYLAGGKGGYVSGQISFAEAAPIFLYVGGVGKNCDTSSVFPLEGGWNGGGTVYQFDDVYGGSGGGATDVRLNGVDYNKRIIVAGAGGGSVCWGSYNAIGGIGGGLTGGNGNVNTSSSWWSVATGGSQTQGGIGSIYNNKPSYWLRGTDGALAIGGFCGKDSDNNAVPIFAHASLGGAGGAGYYGGGSGFSLSDYDYGRIVTSGAGGSSYTSSDFSNASHIQGQRTGNGFITITVNSVKSGFEIYGKSQNEIKKIEKIFSKQNGIIRGIKDVYINISGEIKKVVSSSASFDPPVLPSKSVQITMEGEGFSASSYNPDTTHYDAYRTSGLSDYEHADMIVTISGFEEYKVHIYKTQDTDNAYIAISQLDDLSIYSGGEQYLMQGSYYGGGASGITFSYCHSFTFKTDGGTHSFRVRLYVGDITRTIAGGVILQKP